MEIELRYMTVSVDEQPEGLNLVVWFSTVEFWMSEQAQFPKQYTHVGESCTWIIHSNKALSLKTCAVVTEYADKICREGQEKNKRRQPVNRRK